jgi:hypothetical protein
MLRPVHPAAVPFDGRILSFKEPLNDIPIFPRSRSCEVSGACTVACRLRLGSRPKVRLLASILTLAALALVADLRHMPSASRPLTLMALRWP